MFPICRLTYHFVFEKYWSRERRTPLVLAGRVIVPAAAALTDAQKEAALHAFKIRYVDPACAADLVRFDACKL